MIRIEREHVFPVSVEHGFSVITDLRNWPSYWPNLVRVEPESLWSAPGDQTRLILRLLGREVELVLTLRELLSNSLVVYDSVQAGLPDARHERRFEAIPGGFAYRIVVEYRPRPGIRGLLDRTIVRRGVSRAVHETMSNLERVLSS